MHEFCSMMRWYWDEKERGRKRKRSRNPRAISNNIRTGLYHNQDAFMIHRGVESIFQECFNDDNRTYLPTIDSSSHPSTNWPTIPTDLPVILRSTSIHLLNYTPLASIDINYTVLSLLISFTYFVLSGKHRENK